MLTLTMAGSVDSDTDVVLDPLEVSRVSGEPLDLVNAELAELVAAGAADAV